jgi:hypothetical protein
MQSDNKAKVFAIKSIMNSPKLSKILDEGLQAPIGSTKRQRARSVVAIIKKMSNANTDNSIKNQYSELYRRTFSQDGQGGPNDTIIGSSPTFIRRAPTPTLTSSANKGFTGLLPSLWGIAKEIPGAIQTVGQGIGEIGAGTILGTGALGEMGLSSLIRPSGTNVPNFGQTAGAQLFKQLYPSTAQASTVPKPVTTNKPTTTPVITPAGAKTPAQLGIGFESANPALSYTPTQGQAGYIAPAGTAETTDTSGLTGATGPAPTDTGEINPLAGGDYERLWTTLPASVRQALLNAITPGQFALSMLNSGDLDKLHALLPGVPDSALPTGAGLQGQIDALSDRLKEEYNLNQLSNEYNNAIQSGSTLSIDLTDYIKGRDTYIKNVDDMIAGVKNNMYNKGLTDPASNAANKSYLDYLTVLKGRQNNRYIDLLNNSITRNQAVVTNIENQYNTNFQNYKDQLTSDAAITTDMYNKMYTELSNIAQMVLQGPAAVREAAMQQAQINQTNSIALKDAISAQTSGTDFIKDAKELEPYFMQQDPNTKQMVFQPGINLYDKIKSALMSGKGIDSVSSFLKDEIANAYGTNLDSLQQGKNVIAQFQADGGDELMTQAGYPASFTDDMLATLNQAASRAASAGITSSTTANVKTALDWLTNQDPKNLVNKQNEFFSKFKDTGAGNGVDSRLLNAIWKYYITSANDPNNANLFKDKNTRKTSIFKLLQPNVAEQDGISSLASQLTKYL